MDAEIRDKLYAIAKRACKVTWDDEDTEIRIMEIAENTAASLQHKLGMRTDSEGDFLEPGLVKTLYENYCLYNWNDILDEFETNYRSEILKARHIYEVKHAKENEDQQLQ